MKKKFQFSNLLIGIIFTLLFISLGVIAAVNFRFIYYFDVKQLNIAQTSGISEEVILENYNALIDYNSPFFKGDLIFPTLPSSPSGITHFKEVKDIFVSFYYIAFVSLLTIGGVIYYKHKKKDYSYLKVSAVSVLVIPLIAAIGAIINFDATFVIFHKIFFRNDLWLFDPSTDPVINILPDTYFLHALIVIIIFVVLGSMALFAISRILSNKRRKELQFKKN